MNTFLKLFKIFEGIPNDDFNPLDNLNNYIGILGFTLYFWILFKINGGRE